MNGWVDGQIESSGCPGLFYNTPAQDGVLVRIRIPGGRLNAQQGRAIATFAQQWGCNSIQVTNRANLQVRLRESVPNTEALRVLQSLGLAAQNPVVDHLRNLMTSPTAGIDPQELIDTRPFIQALDTYIQNHPELAALPAKLSIGVDGGGAVGIGTRSAIAWEHRYNEIQLSAVAVDGNLHSQIDSDFYPSRVYFSLSLGSDKQLLDTQVLIHPDHCLSAIAALLSTYLDYLHQVPAAAPKKPRMKQLLQDWGVETYLQQVDDHLTQPLHRLTRPLAPAATLPYGYLGVHPQDSTELSYIGVSLPLGQVTPAQLLEWVQIAEVFGHSELRLTPWQTLLLPDIPNERLSRALRHLSLLGWIKTSHTSGNRPLNDRSVAASPGAVNIPATQTSLANAAQNLENLPASPAAFGSAVSQKITPQIAYTTAIAACAGKPGCVASATQTQPHALALLHHLNNRLVLDRPINIHVTGCPKSCAQPSPAEITLLGTAVEQAGLSVEGYEVYVGDQERSFQYCLGTVIAVDILATLEHLLRVYQLYRVSSQESLGAFVGRLMDTDSELIVPVYSKVGCAIA